MYVFVFVLVVYRYHTIHFFSLKRTNDSILIHIFRKKSNGVHSHTLNAPIPNECIV